MSFSWLAARLACLRDLVAITRQSDGEQELELLRLRQQVRILQRKQTRQFRISASEI